MRFPEFHQEVLQKLTESGSPSFALHTTKDRRSELVYSGVRVPERRKLEKAGFSFYNRDESDVIEIWHDLFMHSPNGDVLFCAIDYLRARVRKRVPKNLWSYVGKWVQRVDNWAHADDLSWVYSYVLEDDYDRVLPTLLDWNEADDLWPKRISIVSLIHYTGKKAVFLSPDVVLPMVARCIPDHRYYMQKATGWVLREMRRGYPLDVETFLETHLKDIGRSALTRATEHMPKDEREQWRTKKQAFKETG